MVVYRAPKSVKHPVATQIGSWESATCESVDLSINKLRHNIVALSNRLSPSTIYLLCSSPTSTGHWNGALWKI